MRRKKMNDCFLLDLHHARIIHERSPSEEPEKQQAGNISR
jgi:hypothetical protein